MPRNHEAQEETHQRPVCRPVRITRSAFRAAFDNAVVARQLSDDPGPEPVESLRVAVLSLADSILYLTRSDALEN